MPKRSDAKETDHCREWHSPNDRLRFTDLAPPDRFCDLILTGSVTSAVAYPGLVAVLGSAYRFHAIGGSSSGAGIAAMAAAAELRRRQGSDAGFRVMLERVGQLAETTSGRTGLRRLFQPAPQHRLLFELLMGTFAHRGRKGQTPIGAKLGPWLLLALAWCAAWPWVLQALGLAPHDGQCFQVLHMSCFSAAAIGTWSLIGAAVWLVVLLALAVGRLLRQDYGVCSGLSPDGGKGADGPALTEWLHDVIQDVAGRAKDGVPLTFEDLARAPGSPRSALNAGGINAVDGIALEMYSANISHGRPYRFPLSDDERLYFKPCEMRRVLPDSVVDHLLASCKAEAENTRWKPDKGLSDEQARWRLPGKKLPVIAAVRMSVAFPLLFTGVRLWAPHGPPGHEELRSCLFLDGGLCSNFPIHLFDSAIPGWPTFGISLRDRKSMSDRILEQAQATAAGQPAKDFDERVFLPRLDWQGTAEVWSRFDGPNSSIARLIGLAGAMLSTVKDWNDATAARMPGVWDRVVRVELEADEGGLNLDMPQEVIECLAHYGVQAGRELLDRYTRADAANGLATGWNNHRWVRLMRLRAAMAHFLDGIGWSMAPGPHAESMSAQIQRAIDEAPAPGVPRITDAQAAVLQRLLLELAQAEQAFKAPGSPLPEAPHPQAELRQRAPL